MGFCLQLRLLLWKNFTLKKRKPLVLMFELFIPLVLFFILLGIRKKQPSNPLGMSKFPAYPLPSAGVIAVMQAFCDNSNHNDSGFSTFENNTVTSFLEKLNNASEHHNFFKPGFTPSDMDQIPSIYRSLVEDPVAVHDLFLNTGDIPTSSVFINVDELENFLISNMSFPEEGIKQLFNTTIDTKKVYELIFGSKPREDQRVNTRDIDTKNFHSTSLSTQQLDILTSNQEFSNWISSNGASLRHLASVLQFIEKHRNRSELLRKTILWVLNPLSSEPTPVIDTRQLTKELRDLVFSGDGMIVLICEQKGLTQLLKGPGQEKTLEDVRKFLCQMNNTMKLKVMEEVQKHLDTNKLSESLKVEQWNITIARNHVKSLINDLKKFQKFETTLRKMSELASALPQDACDDLNSTSSYANETETVTKESDTIVQPTEQPPKPPKRNPQYGLLRIWLGMQRTICGKEIKSSQSLPKDGSEINLDELGMSKNQQEQMGLLVHVLYSNPKVLYSPNNTDADKIIAEANKTFELLDTVTQYAKTMLNVSEEIREFLSLNSTDHSLAVLRQIQQNMKRHPLLLRLSNSSELNEFVMGSIIADKETFLNQLDLIDNAACSWISLMSGLSLNVFRGFGTEEHLITYFKERAYNDNITVLASVIFNMDRNGSLPNHMIYKIRQNASFTSTTNLVRKRFWFPGPRNWGYQYYQFGFVWIQDILERAMINLYAGKDVTEPGTYIHQFPYPCYLQDQFLFMIEHVMPLCMAISWVYSVAMLVQNIVYEKEQRLKEVMKTMGMNNAVHWLAWFIASFTQMTVTAGILTAILKYGHVLTYSNPLVIFFMLEIFVVANISFSFLVSSLYSKAKLAAACAGIIYFLTYVPYMYIAVREEAAHDHIPAWLKSLACLLSTTAFGLGAKYFAFYEEVGVGVQWSNMDKSPVEDDEFSLQNVAVMMVTDTFLYSVLVWYIENVHPGAYGLPKPWYFPFTKSYWLGINSTKPDNSCSCIGKCWKTIRRKGLSVIEDDQACAMGNRADDARYFESDPSHLPLGVCIDNLVKVYKTGRKLAVNRLSINLYEGQITSFLGHNGAGKTTTMSILTGLFPPSSGFATIYGHDIRTDMDIIRQSMGMCPQHNVLFEELSVEEHLWFYARLKGLPQKTIASQVEKMIEDLNLPLKRHSKVNYLSGGMKRKLSVAIAFVAGSQVVILDEPTAGVDPYSRRAIWDLILKYKRGRTILLSTHHMDEADILGDRIAIISHGQLRCCGSSLFLKNNLGEGYHLYVVKKPTNGKKDCDVRDCEEEVVTKFITSHVSSAYLVSESKHELHYIMPLSELRKGSYEKLFTALESNSDQLGIISYGIKNTTLEEVFLKVAETTQESERTSSSRSSPFKITKFSPKKPKKVKNNDKSILLDDRSVETMVEGEIVGGMGDVQLNEIGKSETIHIWEPLNSDGVLVDVDDGANQSPSSTEDNPSKTHSQASQDENISQIIDQLEKAGSYRVEGNLLLLQQFSAILMKRYYCTRRNWKGLFSQILLPAFFVSIAMSVALTAPKIEDLPPLILSPSQYYNYTQPDGNVIPFANNNQDRRTPTNSNNANSEDLTNTLKMPSGVGATCVLKSTSNHFDDDKVNFSIPNFELLSAYFEPMCESVFVHGLRPLENFVPTVSTVSPCSENESNNNTCPVYPETTNTSERFYPLCHCSDDKTGYVCQAYGYKNPPEFKVRTSDVLLNISGQNEHDYYLYTTDKFRLRRYGAFSFGLVQDYVPVNFGKEAPPLFRKVAVRNIAKVWFNNKGFHSMPTYINSMNNAILRANLPASKGNPSAYGITLINHPMTDTLYMLSRDQILQGTDVLIAIFIIVAMSFVPASFVLFLVYERYTKAKHLQFVSGVNAVIYWVSNYFWDMCSYVVPATCCVLILLIFDIPAYASHKNFPAVVSLFLVYGWSITPVMYPVSFLFKEPSTAYIFLIVINLFVGITCIVTSFLLEVFSENAYLGQVHGILKSIFLMFPNYCLGRGLMDIAFNEYQNFFLFKTGQYEKMKSPFEWNLVTRKLVAMAISGLAFFILTLLCEFKFFRKPKRNAEAFNIPDFPNTSKIEDEDVSAERCRVLNGGADSDVLKIVNLTKVYRTRKLGKQLAVNRLCLGVPEGECLGLLGVNGAGKSTTFKMLTGDLNVTGGDAYLNGYSVQRDLQNVQRYIGYCPQFDALYDELTATEHLTLYARFRGIPRKEEKKVVEWALRKLDLVSYADRPSGTYSGGNKRKLSTAIALLGSPPVIYLDEPTTGMDPYTRRFLWDLILELVKSGRAVILTSHSMEECEALCTRLAIMVNGNFKCMGSIQHLKNRFGEGYCITLRTKEDKQSVVQRWFKCTFPDATLKERHYNLLQYELKSGSFSLAYVFSKMETALHDLPIEEYSVCQNTLDNVFINFVKQQSDTSSESNGVCQVAVGGQQELTNLASPRENCILEDEILEDELDSDEVKISRSQSRLAFYNLDVPC